MKISRFANAATDNARRTLLCVHHVPPFPQFPSCGMTFLIQKHSWETGYVYSYACVLGPYWAIVSSISLRAVNIWMCRTRKLPVLTLGSFIARAILYYNKYVTEGR